MIIERDLIKQLKIFLDKKEFLAIIGPRQCGKTVFLGLIKEYLQENKNFSSARISTITFEDRILLEQFNNDPISFVKSYQKEGEGAMTYLMIDEFQYAENGGQKIKLIYDTINNLKLIITGSSSLDLKAQVGKYMVGRILTFFLYPFNFKEFLTAKNERLADVYHLRSQEFLTWFLEGKRVSWRHKGKKDVFADEFLKLFEEFSIWGGYPRAVLSKTKIEKQKILNDIYSNYIIRDIKSLLELTTDRNLLNLSRFLATQTGNILVYKNLSQAAQLDYRRTISHLEILRETFIVDLIKPFFKNRQKELSKNPKVYFFDLGFRNSLMDNFNSFEQRVDVGSMVENIVFLRLKTLLADFSKINFWRTKTGAEVDFVIHRQTPLDREHLTGQGPLLHKATAGQGEIFPIEVKFSSFKKPSISRSFRSFIRIFKARQGLVLTKDYLDLVNIDGCEILFFPVYYF